MGRTVTKTRVQAVRRSADVARDRTQRGLGFVMMSKRLIGILAAVTLPNSIGLAGLTEPKPKAVVMPRPKAAAPSMNSADGIRMTVAFQQPTAYVAEPILLNVTATNVSNRPKNYADTGIYNDFSFVVTDRKGAPVPQTLYGQLRLTSSGNNQSSMTGLRHLNAGQGITYSILVNALYDMTLAEAYHVTVKRKFSDTGLTETVSNTVEVEVVGEDPKT